MKPKHPKSLDNKDQSCSQAWLKLALGCVVLTSIWWGALPWLATCSPLAEHIARMEHENISVDAMFYTELEWDPPAGAAWR